MTDIEYEDMSFPPNSKYPKLLATIKGEQLASPRARELWAKVNEFESEGTARDLAYRLSKVHEEFDFISRKGDESTVVYAQLKAGVTE